MADKEISSLPAAGSIENEDLFVLEQNGIAKKLSGELLKLFSNATRYEIVATLPATGEPNVIYLLTSGTTTTMYVYSGGAWQNVGTLNTTAGDATPLMDGTASPGSALPYSRQDHRHPTDTSKAEKAIMDAVVEPLINQWDEVLEGGQYNATTGVKESASTICRSKNRIPVKPNTGYYFNLTDYNNVSAFFYGSDGAFISSTTITTNSIVTTPANAYFMAFQAWKSGSTWGTNPPSVSWSINYPSSYTGYYPSKVSKVDMPWADLLWENASPTSAFATQTIAIDVTPYRFLAYRVRPIASQSNSVVCIAINDANGSVLAIAANNAGAASSRPVNASSNGVWIGNGSSVSNNTLTQDNTRAIPVEIYGIR